MAEVAGVGTEGSSLIRRRAESVCLVFWCVVVGWAVVFVDAVYVSMGVVEGAGTVVLVWSREAGSEAA